MHFSTFISLHSPATVSVGQSGKRELLNNSENEDALMKSGEKLNRTNNNQTVIFLTKLSMRPFLPFFSDSSHPHILQNNNVRQTGSSCSFCLNSFSRHRIYSDSSSLVCSLQSITCADRGTEMLSTFGAWMSDASALGDTRYWLAEHFSGDFHSSELLHSQAADLEMIVVSTERRFFHRPHFDGAQRHVRTSEQQDHD